MPERNPSRFEIVGRRVDFETNPLAWGIELDIPIGITEKVKIFERSSVQIPHRITTITYLDLNPQESLRKNLRNIQSDERSYRNTSLYDLANRVEGSDEIRIRRLSDLFFLSFGNNLDKIEKFNLHLSKSRAKKIAIAYGHGGCLPITLGEQSLYQPRGELSKIQKKGNEVPVGKILIRYNNPEIYTGILIATCTYPEKRITPLKVSIVYVSGDFESAKSWKGMLPTRVSIPRNV